MDSIFFKTQIKRLQANYANSYPDGTIKALWELIGHVDGERFEKCVTRLMASNVNAVYPPNIDKIEEALNALRVERANTSVPSRFNTNAGYKKTEGGVGTKETSKRIGDILKNIL